MHKWQCNSKLAIALPFMEECFLPMVDPRTDIDMVPISYTIGVSFFLLFLVTIFPLKPVKYLVFLCIDC
ncbi:hypothetical protein KSP39_PZI011696 [Platanthera zijinensis]|uniref:Uncharacterized protein n=1 Tax=Platanthera zijinensis TaxID=2320716 RepID=A0AAP0BHQ7_9ASPA